MKIKVTTKHFRNSKGYQFNHACPLALAVKEAIKDPSVRVRVAMCEVILTKNGVKVEYDVTIKWCGSQQVYGGKWEGKDIDTMIKAAKADKKLRFPTIVLDLTKIN